MEQEWDGSHVVQQAVTFSFMLTRESILELKVADLKTELTKLGLDTKGLKADLQERLLATLEPSAGAGAGAASAGGDPAIAPSAAAAPAAAAPVAVPTGAVDMYAAAAAAAQQAALAQAPAVVAPSTTQPSDLGTSQQHQANDANDAASAADAHTAAVPSHNAGLENSAYANAYAPEHAQEVVQPVDAYQAQQFDQQPVVPMESES
ncbi:hypothetical protein CAOG_05479 [Capsaspora owczarzaki ATCC 30864]|uniref:hypothetical protein n=1 Tax=Capsaspora owczarzaki (strain ATCC 30864) TaxID=595528 RepID=UPI0001FE40F3|nr:hypothetical protein CAOG_05479 [Capsaspora owczarzaki ATCC 30864]|eukprot:XP_004346152.1 hypothetical protein CAOG_05479 [Capsaspora owczarzaki ATCC 30864]